MRFVVLVLAVAAGAAAAKAYEEPEYELVHVFEDYELRRYAPQLVAETQVSGSFDETGNEAFRILAAFISGENRAQRKLAMTAPVSQEPVSEEIAMTAPVSQRPVPGTERTWIFRFVMPARYTRETLPEPTDPRVAIRELPARLMAARRFSGFWRESRFRENEAALLAALERAGLEPSGEPGYARYNSPFTPWFLRRNEVWVEIAR